MNGWTLNPITIILVITFPVNKGLSLKFSPYFLYTTTQNKYTSTANQTGSIYPIIA